MRIIFLSKKKEEKHMRTICVKVYPKCERLQALMKKYWKGEQDENN